MDAEVDQVLTICPDVDVDDVIRDLNCTGSAEATINRIFEGTFLSGFEEDLSTSSSPHRNSNHEPVHREPLTFDSDDELPDICITKIRTNRPRHTPNASVSIAEKPSGIEERLVVSGDFDGHDVPKTLPDSTSPSGDERTGRVDRWLQENRLSATGRSEGILDLGQVNTDPFRRSPSAEHLSTRTSTQKELKRTGSDTHKRQISISSSEDELELLSKHKTEQNSDRLHEPSSSSYSKPAKVTTMMKRSCSPISVSDSDDDEELLTLTLKQRIQGHTRPRNESPQAFSMDWDSETLDSQQTGETCSTMGTSSACSMTQDSQDPTGKKKRKRTPEEIEVAKSQALERKRQKESEREAKKQEKQKESDKKKALQAAKKADRPEECMKFVRVVLDPVLLEDVGGAAILGKLESLDSKYTIESQPVTSVVTWRRLDAGSSLGEDIHLQSIGRENDENEALVLIPTSIFVDLVYVFKEEQQGVFTGEDSLRKHVVNVKKVLRGKQVTLMVMNMEAYFRKEKNCKNRHFRSAVLGTQGDGGKTKKRKKGVEEITTSVSRVDVEEALVDLQLHTDCNVRFEEKAEQVAELIAMFTKSVAETPFKRERDKPSFSFHVDNEWAGGIRVSKEGIGLLKLWRQQLQQFRNVSPEIASTIVAVYPSPRLLLKAYNRCRSVGEAQMLLQDIMVRRGEGVLASSRRVGGALSKRVYTLLTAQNGELVL